MTKFWPASMMLDSPALRAEQKLELVNFRLTGVSEQTMAVCHALAHANSSRGMEITMLRTEGAVLQRVYVKRPTQENWQALERNIFIDTGDNFAFNVAVLQ